jgi:D-alanyl-D-alanine dipeptidase
MSYLAFVLLIFFSGCAHRPATVKESLQYVSASPQFVEIKTSNELLIDLKYATPDNFVGRNMYGEFNRAFLHHDAAFSLIRAAIALKKLHPNWKLIIYDALRPRSIQYVLWNKVKGTADEQYVADPEKGSLHNYGLAVDLSIIDEKGKPIDMGTSFDSFDVLAQPKLEDQFLKEGKLSRKQIQNRQLLRKVMQDAGFIQLPHEWWHYNRYPIEQVRTQFSIVE